jgi:hypothetical protein
MGKNVSDYRERAVHCRERAAAVSDPKSKEYWLRMADDWAKLAESTERAQDRK